MTDSEDRPSARADAISRRIGLPAASTTRRQLLGGLLASSAVAGRGAGTTAGSPSPVVGSSTSHGYGAGGYGMGGYGGGDTLQGPPPLPGQDARPLDPDGDGIYEDVDGDGSLTLDDVRLYYQEIYLKRESTYVQENRQYFDESGDGEISLSDVHQIFEEIVD